MSYSGVVVIFDRVVYVAYIIEFALDSRFKIDFHLIYNS